MRPAASAAARASSYERAGTSAVENSVAAPATDTDSSSSGVSPLVPMAPTTSPSTVSGMPPVSARAPCRARAPRRPPETCSSSSRLGRTKIAAVRALSTATRELATWAPGVRRSATSSPLGSTTAMTTRWPAPVAYRSAAANTASAPASSIVRRVRAMSGSPRVKDDGVHRRVGGDEQDVAVGPAEREVHGARKVDEVELLAARREHAHARGPRRVDPALDVDDDPIGVAALEVRDDPLAGESLAVDDVERLQVVWGAVVGDVEDRLVGREREAVGLVERVGDDRQLLRARLVAVDDVARLRRRTKALQVPVARIGEPDRAVARDDDVVGRVERAPAPAVDHRRALAGRRVERGDARGRIE